jgi:hypothetical protein
MGSEGSRGPGRGVTVEGRTAGGRGTEVLGANPGKGRWGKKKIPAPHADTGTFRCAGGTWLTLWTRSRASGGAPIPCPHHAVAAQAPPQLLGLQRRPATSPPASQAPTPDRLPSRRRPARWLANLIC